MYCFLSNLCFLTFLFDRLAYFLCPCICSVNSYSARPRQLMHCDTLKQDNDSTVRGDGEVGSARYEPALHPPCLSIRILSYSNCQEIQSRQQTGPGSVSVKQNSLCVVGGTATIHWCITFDSVQCQYSN